MHIALSGTFLSRPDVGTGQYLHALLRWLPRVAPGHRYTLLLPASATDVVVPPGVHGLSLRTPFDRRSAYAAKLFLEQVAAPAIARQINADLLHVPYFAGPLRAAIPVVVTAHDLIPLVLPEYRGSLPVRIYMRLAATAARRATHLLADSHHTRADLLHHLHLDPRRVTTVYLGAGPAYEPQDPAVARQVAEALGLAPPFIYYVGGFDARKNVPVLLQALPALRARLGPGLRLVLAGRLRDPRPPLLPDLRPLIRAAGPDAVVTPGYLPDPQNAALLAAATAVAYPSRYEGFGLPALEALSCGAALAVADATSLPEVVGQAALRIPPDDVAAWAAGLTRLLDDAELNATMRARALQQAAQFSAERMARETVALYETLV